MSMSYEPQDSLSLRISEGRGLTEDEVDALVGLLGNRCQQRNKARLRWALKACLNMQNYGIYSRVLLHDEGEIATYCTGQSYPDEIRTVRECLIGR